MVFTVDEEKKRTWNHGWWKRWFQGRVLLTLFLIGILSFVLMLPRYIKDTMIWWENIRVLADNEEFAIREMWDIVCFGVQITFMACGIPVLSYRNAAATAFQSESLIVEDGLLRWITLANSEHMDTNKPCFALTVCKVDDCDFSFEKKTRMLEISARGDESIFYGLCDTLDVALSAPIENLEPAGSNPYYPEEIALYPYFNPDLIHYLRDLGVEVKGDSYE